MKKRLSILFLLFIFSLTAVACSNANKTNTQSQGVSATQSSSKDKKTLIVYYTRSGNTKEVASQIQKRINADIVEIKTIQPYPKDYTSMTKQAQQELESGFKPELQPINIDLSQYDTIFIGSPCWWSTISTPVISFLSKNDMSGKTIIPFMTHQGSSLGRSVAHIKKLAPTAIVKEGLAIKSSNVKNSQDDIILWLQKLNINK